MQHNLQRGFTLTECCVSVAIITILFFFVTPLVTWYTQQQANLITAQIITMINYAKSQALLRHENLRLVALKKDNWSLGARLEQEQLNGEVLYEWHWLQSNINLIWHGFKQDALHFPADIQHYASNGYFLLMQSNKFSKKIIINRLGSVKIE